MHEDHDILGIFSPYEYTWVKTGKGLFQIGCFVAVFLTVVYGVKLTYPDRVSYPREFEGGLERELGGAGAVRASQTPGRDVSELLTVQCRLEWRATRTLKYGHAGSCVYSSSKSTSQPRSFVTICLPFLHGRVLSSFSLRWIGETEVGRATSHVAAAFLSVLARSLLVQSSTLEQKQWTLVVPVAHSTWDLFQTFWQD